MVGKRPRSSSDLAWWLERGLGVPVTLLGGWKEADELQSPCLVVGKRPKSSSHLAWLLERGRGVPVTLLGGWKEAEEFQ